MAGWLQGFLTALITTGSVGVMAYVYTLSGGTTADFLTLILACNWAEPMGSTLEMLTQDMMACYL